MRHQFVTLLGSGIKTDRIIHFVIGTIRDFGITAIDRTGRSVHQMLYSILPVIITVAACFKNIVKTDKITFDVCIRIDNTITYTCLSSKVNYHIKAIIIKKAIDKNFISKVASNKSISTLGISSCNLFYTI